MEEDSKTYREYAVQARLGAREATRPDFKAVFERLAESYEAKARDAEPAYRDMQRDIEAREPSMPRGQAVKPEA
jgi:hypothetical protein